MKIPITIVANSQVSYNSMGGSDKIFLEMARVWKGSGYPLVILGCPEAGRMCSRSGLDENFRKVVGFEVEKVGLLISYTLRTVFSVFRRRLIKQGLLYSSSDFFPDLVFSFWQKCLNSKIKWVAGIFLIAPNPLKIEDARNIKGFIYWLTQRVGIILMRLRADLVVVLGQEDKDFLIKKRISETRIVVISGGVDWEVIDEVGEQEKIYDACFVGRFHKQKGLPELISVWGEVVQCIPQAKLAIVGWGERYWLNLVRELISESNLGNNIFLLGFLDGKDKYKIIKSSRTLLFPSSYESWGIVVAEALACGRPVVAFDIPATRRFNKGIVLVRQADLQTFAKNIIELLRDEGFYSRLSFEAGDLAKEFSWKSSADSIIQALSRTG